MKNFDLEAALKGAPVITGGNHPARIICTDAKGNLPIIALISNNGVENPVKYTLDGRYYTKGASGYDLYMDVVKKKGYINIWKNKYGENLAEGIFSTREEAVDLSNKINSAISYRKEATYVNTIEIEWEE